jgi:hypothetical protein
MPQVQGQMFITGRKYSHFICWTPEGLEVHEVPFDDRYWGKCMTALAEFWECWKKDIEPPRQKKLILPTVEIRKIV